LRLGSALNIKRAADALLATMFYIELCGEPDLTEIGFHCHIRIRCRIYPATESYIPLLDTLCEKKARFHYDYRSIPCVDRQCYEIAKQRLPFSRRFDITVLSLKDAINVEVDGITRARTSISNYLYIVEQLVEDQGLNCVFGHCDHRKRGNGLRPVLRRSSTYI
jgi:hypothetical protein